MSNPRKYMLFLALAVPAIYAYAASREEIAKPRWLHDISGAVNKSLDAKPEAEVPSVDPKAAARVDEDLDYRIAARTKSTEGWRAFLSAHPDGPHTQLARAELDKLAAPVTPNAPTVVQAPDIGAAETKTSNESVSVLPPSTESDAATPAADEICRDDEDRLERLSNGPTSDGLIRLLIELRCEKLRPQLLHLAERLDNKAQVAPADAAQNASSSVLPVSVVSAPPLPPPRMRANEPSKRPRSTLSSREVEPKRHATQRIAPNLPQLLLAFFGGGPRNSSGVRRFQAAAGPGGGH
jgi:hypothetical protein